ncbi:DHA2 family efflux MFS transporter permease subunit [Staphylococcus massiliensis]|uniref:Quinolone resistance protein NorB n=1 Tax=Staphylococcus massiliensis S46 TaxID=1229783 RepID=K9B5J5_9STAP|nr:DHA2 family efflux MFS transporter permease subunit [Staphylococcus massiliensis]EKU49045.1 major facilitator superfamily permease [Staphylococcus massiliensis S46]MCG3399486.1 DHA2 family efflux MFS transporter permease subunit [Staphylococcus massiliensis]MCG3402414.1 DHA2 family efflux MFS transporter permease subunit [Staphylococcus massiliensis]MCG3411622.1 DHA2 family efflux MFS transporter permease subunit [Staphylococcus massiliensis]POA01464.1 MFS transporter [Staphylococcus massil
MNMTIVILYVIVALLLIAGLNFLLIKNGKKKKAKQTSHNTKRTNDDYNKSFSIDDSEDESVNESAKSKAAAFTFGKGISKWQILVAMIFGMFIAILNQTLLNTALPVMINDFSISNSTGQWLMTGFMLVNGILIPISAFLFNKYTYRKLFLVAMTLFTLGSLVCGLAGSFPIMMVGRVLQAIGAGVLMPLGTNVFMTIFPPERRGAAMGLLGVAMILAPAIGPTLSGYIVENYHWNIMFYGMFIVGLIALLLGYIWFKVYQETTNPKADILGIIFSTLGFGALLYGFSEAGNDGWGSIKIIVTFIIGIIFTILFVFREMSMRAPMLNFEVLKYSGYTLTSTINIITMMSLFGGMLLLPIYLQNLRGFSALDSGLLLLPGALVMGLMGPIAGKLLDMIGIKPLAIVGLAIMTYGTWELTKLNMDTPYSQIVLIYVIRSFGMSFIMMPIMTAGMNALPQRLIPHGNALVNTLRQLGGSIGTAILVTVMTQQTTQYQATYAQDLDKTNPMIQDRLRELAEGMGGQEQGTNVLIEYVMKLASVHGINSAFWVATALSFIALVLSLFLKGKSHYISHE